MLRILSEELRETKSLVIETRRMAVSAEKTAEEAKRQADAAWEFVIMTKNQFGEELHYMRLPWWKKLLGQTA